MRWTFWRKSPPTCPHGHGDLQAARMGGLPIHICPLCRGEWIDNKILRGFYPQPIPHDNSPCSIKCPSCRSFLRHHPASHELPVALESCPKNCGWWLDQGERQRLSSLHPIRPRLRLKQRPQAESDHRLAMARRYAVEQPRQSPKESTSKMLISPWELDAPRRLIAWLGFPVESGRFFDTRASMTLALIFINVAIFSLIIFTHVTSWFFVLLGWLPEMIRQDFALWPARLIADPSSQWPTLISCMFLHGGLAHLLGNMLFLFIAGDDVEMRIGRWNFLFFYVFGGMVASVASLIAGISPEIPRVGASGAISAVMGAYLIFARGKRIYSWGFRFLLWGRMIGYPSALYLLFWFASQFAMMLIPDLNVDFWAHIGGFIFGVAGALLLSTNPHTADEPS